MSTNRTQAELTEAVKKMLEGWERPLDPQLESMSIKGTHVTPEALRERLRAFLFALQEPEQIYALYTEAIARRRLAEAANTRFVADLSTALIYQLGEAVAQSHFGVQPPKQRSEPSVETKMIANYKREKTRVARHIMGKNQRAAVTVVPEPVITVTESHPAPAQELPAPASSSQRLLSPKPDEPTR